MSSATISPPATGLYLLTASTPNGYKPSIALEELKAVGAISDYKWKGISFSENEQKSEAFLKVNPNGRIPALVDARDGKKKPINVWESASILMYLAKTYDTKFEFHFKDEDDETEMYNWIFFIQGGVGPMQANHFFRYAPEKIPYGIKRYQDETKRLYSVYEAHLAAGKDFLVGEGKGKYSYADMCTFPWVRSHDWAGVSTADFPHVEAWLKRISDRPAVKAGLAIPEQDALSRLAGDKEGLEKYAKESSKWIMKGQEQK